MRRFLTVALALVAGLFVLGVPSALAGGPTSVLLVNHETGRSAAALNGSAAYTELQSILGEGAPPAASARPPGDVASSTATVRLVWLIHDISPWRIDSVHVVGEDVWVETSVDFTGGDPYAGTPTWHQPARGDDLVASLTGLGVLGSGGAGTDVPAGASGALAPSSATGSASATAPSGIPTTAAVALTVGGVLAGAALGGLLSRHGLRRLRLPRRAEVMG